MESGERKRRPNPGRAGASGTGASGTGASGTGASGTGASGTGAGTRDGVAVLEVIHRTRTRIRVAVMPKPSKDLLRALADLAQRIHGVDEAELGASETNLVVRYDPRQVAERTILMRVALALSKRQAFTTVRLVFKREVQRLGPPAVASGAVSALATALAAASKASGLAGASGWMAAGLTLSSVGRDIYRGFQRGKARPEGLSALYLLSNMGSPNRASSALLTWLLYHGAQLVESLRGGDGDGLEVRPVEVRGGVGEDKGTHYEVLTRPIRLKSPVDGEILSPATLATAVLGYLTFALKEGAGE